ncbi:34338_t:CDS:1, partial [Racocetra persica]
DIPETIKERIGAVFNRLPANNPNLTEQQRTDIDYWPTDQTLLILHIEELIEQTDI